MGRWGSAAADLAAASPIRAGPLTWRCPVPTALPAPAEGLSTRSHLWRLPLVALVVAGVLSLRHLDQVLRREYQAGARAQAAQGEAYLEGVVQQRVSALHNLTVLIAAGRPGPDQAFRFALVAPQVRAVAPDVARLYLLDEQGDVRDTHPRTRDRRAAPDDAALGDSAVAAAVARAERTHLPVVASVTRVEDGGGPGLFVVDPIVRGARVVGHVAAALPHRTTLGGATAAALAGAFAYRVTDDGGRTIGAGGDYPSRTSYVERREITLPSGGSWRLDVAVPAYEPIVPRLLTWFVGVVLLLLVIVLVLREERRAERFAQHSFNLELLSRDLLDANLRLEDRAQQVAEANRAKSRFLANVSHELRTPLNAIVGYNGLAIDGVYGDLPPALRQAHERIGAAAEHLLGVVNDVLDLSKIEVGRMHVDDEVTDLQSLLDSVATVLEPIAAAKELRVDLVVAPDLPRVVTDPRHVRQIVLNLASNAVKFTEHGSVSIVAERDGRDPDGHVVVIVRDTGIGIEEGDLARIFEEFEQVRPAGRGDSLQRGTGLGLAIARKLARLLGGDVEARSRPGVGSAFTLRLPIHREVAAPAGHSETHGGGEDLGAAVGERVGGTSGEGVIGLRQKGTDAATSLVHDAAAHHERDAVEALNDVPRAPAARVPDDARRVPEHGTAHALDGDPRAG